MKSYCIFCKSGAEQSVAQVINRHSQQYVAIAPKRVLQEKRNGVWQNRELPLLPGYVFLYTKDSNDKISDIRSHSNINVNADTKANSNLAESSDAEANCSLTDYTNTIENATADTNSTANANANSNTNTVSNNTLQSNDRIQVRANDMYKILQYDAGIKELSGDDKQYALWIYNNSGYIKSSKLFECGDGIKVIEGPLHSCMGRIIRLDKHKRRAIVEFDFDGCKRTVSLSADCISAYEEKAV